MAFTTSGQETEWALFLQPRSPHRAISSIKTSNIETVKIVRSFLALKYPELYGPNLSMSLNRNLQSSLALISLLAFNRTTDI